MYAEGKLPDPDQVDGVGPQWKPATIERWAEREWWETRRWRKRPADLKMRGWSNMRLAVACLILLVGCGGADSPTDRRSPPPSPSPTPEVEDFTEQWCLALDSLEAAVTEGPYFPGNDAAISDLTVTADALDRLVSDLQDARLSAPASEIRSLAATVREEIAAIDVEGTSADDIIESFDGQTRALKRMREALQAPGETFGASCPG
jgi:hypothetical protein